MSIRVTVRVSLVLVSLVLVSLVVSACSGKANEGSGDAPTSISVVESLSLLAGNPLSDEERKRWETKLRDGEATADDFVDRLVTDKALGRIIAPNLLFSPYLNVKNYYAIPSGYTLKTFKSPTGPIHYLRDRCEPDAAIVVAPWWDLRTTVKVCPDSYSPERWSLAVTEHSYRSEMPLSCDSQVGSPEKEDKALCGCGPNLYRCLPDFDAYRRMQKALSSELRDTTAHIVNSQRPLKELFTTEYSMRGRDAEALYQRRAISATQGIDIKARLKSISRWPEEPFWGRREPLFPGQHAGVLTGLQLMTWAPDRRQRQRLFMEVMWCSGRDSFGATTEKIFEISNSPNLAFTSDSWELLANTEVCTNCHARLDYGFQFFKGYPDARAGTHFMESEARSGNGPLYGDNINDLRGETLLTPASFAQLATAQPEFPECIASHISNYVLGPAAPKAQHQEILDEFTKKGIFRDAFRLALLLRFKNSSEPNEPVVNTSEVAGSAHTGADIAIDTELRAAVDEYCQDCHDNESIAFGSVAESYGKAVYLGEATWSKELAVRALEQVAYLNMPRNDALRQPEREALVAKLITSIWAAPDDRKRAHEYYSDQFRPLPSHQLDLALELAHQGLSGEGTSERTWGSVERSIYSDQLVVSPGYAAVVALEIAAACTEAHTELPAQVACMKKRLTIKGLGRLPN
tara:strand:+ start:40191 stop:42257 length:2067 start_codon:yes stop_codon:yes gene_type:complete